MKNRIKCIGAIMNRHSVGEQAFVFTFGHVAIGYYNEKRQAFIDKNDNIYYHMTDPMQMDTQVETAFANLLKLDTLAEAMEEKNIKNAIKEYEYRVKELFYFIGKIDDEHVFSIPININESKYEVINNYQKHTKGTYFENINPEAIEEIILKVINGDYDIEELKAIKTRLTLEYENLESLLDTLDIQIEEIEDDIEPPKKITNKEPKVKIEEPVESKIDIDDLFNKVTKTLIAQDYAAKRVIAEIARKELDIRKKKEGILLTGKTGVGKTELMRLIAKYLDRPFYKVDSTQLTMPGYVGRDIEEVLWDLYVKCGKDIKKTEEAIIFFDEIDKKGSKKKSDVSGQAVLNVLLPFIEGATYDACVDLKIPCERVKIDTSNMIVILGGAYTDVYKTDNNHKTVGFSSSKEKEIYKPTTKDFIEKGLMTDEFMSRITVINLKDLSVEDIKRIMLESDESAIKIQQEIFNKLGVKLTFTDGYTNAVAKNAYDKKTGARGLNAIVDESTWKAFEEVYSHENIYEEVILNEETTKDPNKYVLIKKKN